MRIALFLSLVLVACASAQSAPEPRPAPRNFVCERIALKNPTAKCESEYVDAGEHHLHTARVTIGADTVSCGINDTQLAVVCDGLFVAVKQPDQADQNSKQAPKSSK